MTEDGHLAVIFVRPAVELAQPRRLGGHARARSRQIVARDASRASRRARSLGYTGSIPLALTEVEAIQHDIVSTAILVLLGVGLVVGLYFRGMRELGLMSGAVIVGAAVALGFAELWIGHVNAQTAFLGAIIVGTGINYGIILLDRYRQARVRVDGLEAALEAACDEIAARDRHRRARDRGRRSACSPPARSRASTSSAGSAAIGILACWIATFTIVPAAWCWSIATASRVRSSGYAPIALGVPLARSRVRARPRLVLAVVDRAARRVGSGLLAIAARHRLIETDLRKLGTKSAAASGIEKLDNRLRMMDDQSSSPAVIATDSARGRAPRSATMLNERAQDGPQGPDVAVPLDRRLLSARRSRAPGR